MKYRKQEDLLTDKLINLANAKAVARVLCAEATNQALNTLIKGRGLRNDRYTSVWNNYDKLCIEHNNVEKRLNNIAAQADKMAEKRDQESP